MRSTLLALFAVLALPLPAGANGKFFWREMVPPGVPFQRALILHEDIYFQPTESRRPFRERIVRW